MNWIHQSGAGSRYSGRRAIRQVGVLRLPLRSTARRMRNRPVVLDLVTALVDSSLSKGSRFQRRTAFQHARDDPGIALEQLAAHGEVRVTASRHAAYVLKLAQHSAPLLEGPDQIAWLHRLDREIPNIRAALDWLSADGDPEPGSGWPEPSGPFGSCAIAWLKATPVSAPC